ncbi:hypothetical protein [Staphylococcus americanisciuri]|uniref:Mid2-like cell wall stress sensor domain protein n=1 Tax=Staphylococcus americanisciuri TaxID=2973940 RepID=A0ABT2F0S8_9STAP|nr:hypothetical protein [Staphylococcus americanisciuri]MCS4486053.1 hypothetical protein [Staphylococcus americanisciuri]
MSKLGIILIVLLIVSFLPNIYMLYKTKKDGTDSPRVKLMVGIDALLVVLLLAAVLLLS